MGIYQRLAGLPLTVEDCRFAGLELVVSQQWRRRTTLIRLRGRGEEGVGEDVTYESKDHLVLQRSAAPESLRGRYTLASFSARTRAKSREPFSVEIRLG